MVRDTALRWERLLTLAPLLLATFFGLWSLRGVSGSNIADYDSPTHALNGAFVFDMFRHWKIPHPVEYGYWYYSRLPALSLPYHPPLFPVLEALIFSIFGVSPFSSRLAVAIATSVAVLLMIRLVRKSHGSRLLALMVTASFFALPTVQRLSNTVMLEIPALVFVLAAFLFLVPDEEILQTRRSLWFAIFAAAAVWTKQTVFLFLLPFLYVLVSGRCVATSGAQLELLPALWVAVAGACRAVPAELQTARRPGRLPEGPALHRLDVGNCPDSTACARLFAEIYVLQHSASAGPAL
jgi:4-amino-4-deoxy-L-arabinose transferase-like glycosyltransferase